MPSFSIGRELAGLRGLLVRGTGALAMPHIFNEGKPGSLLDKSLRSVPSTSKTDAGRALGNTLGNELQYMGRQLQKGSLPYLGNEMRYTTNELLQGRNPYGTPLNGIQTGKYGPTDWNPSANPTASVSSGGAADRSYQQEKARVTQMTEQDPMFKKYQVAELSKQYNAAKGDEREKIGMQIWAQTNPELAAKLRPGATGYSDVATAFQKLSPVGNLAGSMAPSNFTMPAVDSNTIPTVEQAFGTNAPQFNIPGMDASAMTTAVAPGAFNQPLSTDITKYLTDPVKAYAPTEKVDQTKLALLRQAYNQRFK